MSDVKWCVALTGEAADLEELCQRLTSSDRRVEKVKNEYRLYSTRFDDLAVDGEVNAEAQQVIALLNLAGILRIEGFQPIKLVRVIQINADGAEQYFIHLAEKIRLRASAHLQIIHSDGTTMVPQPESLVPLLTALESAPDIARAAMYVRHEPNWYGYYKAFEAIREHVGGQGKLLGRRWFTKRQLDRFTWSAQPARHDNKLGPADPMMEADGRSFVLALIERAIAEALLRPVGPRQS